MQSCHHNTSGPASFKILPHPYVISIIYLNDILTNQKSKISFHADGTMFYESNRLNCHNIFRLQRHNDLASEWFSKWRLKDNTSKTIVPLFSRSHITHIKPISLKNVAVQYLISVQFLEVKIGNNLKHSF